MCKRIFKKYFLIFSLFIYECLISQTNNLYYHDDIGTIYSGENIIIKQLIFTQEPILNGMLFFRNKGEISYQETEMFFENGRWQGLIPGDRVTIQGIEYVTILTTVNGGRISMPLLNNPFDNPIDVIVLPRKSIDKNSKFLTRSGKSSIESDMIEADILILSPEDGSINRPDEIVISVSLFNAPNVDKNTFKVYIDGKDYTDEVTIFDDVLSLVPNDELGIGLHKIRILSKSTFGIDIVPVEWAFSATKGIKNLSEQFIYSGSFNGKVSRNTVSNISNNEEQSSGKLNAELSWIKASFSFRQTDRESEFLQPLNRRNLTLKITDYFSFERGDVFPSISPYSIDGKRIYGQYINAGFKFFDFHYASGKQIRAVQFREGTDKAFAISSDKISYLNNSNRIIKLDRRGYTFPRNIITSRLNISAFNLFKAGVHFYKAKDDFDEIDRKYEDFKIDNNEYTWFQSKISLDTTLTGDSIEQIWTISELVDKIKNDSSSILFGDSIYVKERNWGSTTPKENLVLGFDFETALDNRRILFQTGWNTSFTNSNIWAGTANKDSLDLLMDTLQDGMLLEKYDVSGIGEFIDNFEGIFTIHPLYMSPILPIDPIVSQDNILKAILNMPASAYYLRLKSSYSFNNILIQYRQHGSEFLSLGNPYLTNNIREFTINNRLSTLGRRLMIVLGYIYKDNNLSETVANPIATKTLSLNTTLVPGSGAPSLTFNVKTIGRKNSIDTLDYDKYDNPIGDNREDSKAFTVMASINIPGNFKYFTSTTSLNINSLKFSDNLSSERSSYLERKKYDNIPRTDLIVLKSETESIAATFSARFNFPLKTSITVNQAKVTIPMLDNEDKLVIMENIWTTTGANFQYSMIGNKLRFNGGLDYMTNGELTSIIGGKFGSDFDIINKMTVSFYSMLRISDGDINSSGLNVSLGYRF